MCLVNAAYVPGTPGGSWTKDELVTVKAKLYSIFRHNKAPKAPKVVRLGFHDCLKYADGSGGCDGCLNWQVNIYVEFMTLLIIQMACQD